MCLCGLVCVCVWRGGAHTRRDRLCAYRMNTTPDNSDMIRGLLMERSHHTAIVRLSIWILSHCPRQTLINSCGLDETPNLPPCHPLNSLTRGPCIVTQRSCTHFTVPRHIFICAHTLGPLFSRLPRQVRSGVRTVAKATLHAPVFIDKVACATERNHLQQTHFYTLKSPARCTGFT